MFGGVGRTHANGRRDFFQVTAVLDEKALGLLDPLGDRSLAQRRSSRFDEARQEPS